jgi:pimeloyl-ACP methyl ester carboxylesterase
MTDNATTTTKPTIVLVHGAFAESSSWNGVINVLVGEDFRVRALANPLRVVKADASNLASALDNIEGEELPRTVRSRCVS